MVFCNRAQTINLKKQSYSGIRWTTFSSLGRAGLQLLQIIILARLLRPEDFGVFAIVIAITAILQMLSDMGVSNAIIHFQKISQTQLSSLYWLNICASVVLALLIILLSPSAASYFAISELQPLLTLAALTLFITPFGQQIRVVAQKHLRFAALAKVELFSALAGFLVAVSVALLGGGVFALVAGSLTVAITGTLTVWLYLADGWRPAFRLQIHDVREFLKFGIFMIGNNIANTIIMQIDVLIGGRIFDAQSLGLYSLPKNLSLRIAGIINPIITNVGFPVMAKVQEDSARIKNIYLQTIRMTASVNFPIYMALGIFAPEIVNLFLGDKWQDAIPLLRILTTWAFLRSIGNPVGSLLLAVGRVKLSFKWTMAWLLFTPPVIWFGSQFGTEGMAVALTGLVAIMLVPQWFFLIRPICGAKFKEYFSQLVAPFTLSLTAGFIGYFAAQLFLSPMPRLAFGLAASAASYLLLSYFFNSVWFSAMLKLLDVRNEKFL